MMKRFAAASAVASVLIALAAGCLRLIPVPTLERGYLATSVWCVVPLAWGLWAMLTPKSWLPERLPLWGAILGLIAGLLEVFVLEPAFRGEPLPLLGIVVLLEIIMHYLLWLPVQRAYQALTAPSPAA